MHPKKAKDFDILYNELEAWRLNETKKVKSSTELPIIIGGGIRSIEEMDKIYKAGANLLVIGNKIEEDVNFLLDLANYFKKEKTDRSSEN